MHLFVPRKGCFFLMLAITYFISSCSPSNKNNPEMTVSTQPSISSVQASTELLTQDAQSNLETSQPIEPQEPTETLPELTPDLGIVWQARFETGNLSEYKDHDHGDFTRQGFSGTYNMVTPNAHTGRYSVALTIDTEAPSDTGAHAAYLWFWDHPLTPDDSYYYSAWYYIPSDVKPSDWWNIWQWVSKKVAGSDEDALPIFNMSGEQGKQGLGLRLTQWPSLASKIVYKQDVMDVPVDKWFQIEAFYKRAQDTSGQVVVWLDGVEIFNVLGVQTVLGSNEVSWGVNNYAANIQPSPCTIYVDDIFISKKRIGPISLALP
ncbi:MAG: polysaccharide lyase [Anaerolineales bacterium]|nr:polysaccharide lyase [Anaerolineales bacterium]